MVGMDDLLASSGVRKTSLHSAAQEMLLLTVADPLTIPPRYRDFLKNGETHFVLRRYKSEATYWNLQGCLLDQSEGKLCLRETAAYRIAKNAFESKHSDVVIPEVLYVADRDVLFSYVGEGSNVFASSEFDDTLSREMVKTRLEYGFDEPHPRHGRVDIDRCEIYAKSVLEEIVAILHTYNYHHEMGDDNFETDKKYIIIIREDGGGGGGGGGGGDLDQHRTKPYPTRFTQVKTFSSMLMLYKEQFQKVIKFDDPANDVLIQKTISNLESKRAEVEKLAQPAVLIHCDLQPQNLMFRAEKDAYGLPRTACLLDWEDAAFADGRFEILLICRKIVANIQQARNIWQYYKILLKVETGSIEPWLKLESLHSLCTYKLQNNPCDSGKIERELERLKQLQQIV